MVVAGEQLTMFSESSAISATGDVKENVITLDEYSGVETVNLPETTRRMPAVGETFVYDGERFTTTKVEGNKFDGRGVDIAGATIKGATIQDREFTGTATETKASETDNSRFEEEQDKALAQEIVNDDLLTEQEKREELAEYGLDRFQYLLDGNNPVQPYWSV